MEKTANQIIGEKIEDLVNLYLQRQGLKLIATNYHCKLGEIDLIMNDKETLVFVEVRYRKNSDFGCGISSVNKSKQQKIIRAATCYLQQHNLYDKVECRFDVVGVSGESKYEIDWVKDAFWIDW